MDTRTLVSEFTKLLGWQQEQLIQELKQISNTSNYESVLKSRGDTLDNKSGECPHCGSFHYSKVGTD